MAKTDVKSAFRIIPIYPSLAPEKLVGPDTVLQFAGITLDSVLFEARLLENKLAKCRVMLHNVYTRRTVTLKELQSLGPGAPFSPPLD